MVVHGCRRMLYLLLLKFLSHGLFQAPYCQSERRPQDKSNFQLGDYSYGTASRVLFYMVAAPLLRDLPNYSYSSFCHNYSWAFCVSRLILQALTFSEG